MDFLRSRQSRRKKMAKKKANIWTYAMEEMSYPDVQAILKTTDVALIPIGSQEKHGPHVPLATDSIATIETVRRAAEKAKVPYTPLIPVGYSPHHMGTVNDGIGTLSFTGETLRRIMYEIGRCLIFHGFNKLIYASQHASNTKVTDEVLRRLRYETGCFCAWYMTPTERKTQVINDILDEKIAWHSGEMETAQCMAYDESCVHMERAKKHKAHAPKWLGPAFAKTDGVPTVIFQGTENIFIPMEHHEYAQEATIGDPFLGTKEKGEKIFERASDNLAAFVNEVKKLKITIEDRTYDDRAW
jgi:creatinine amidohydrolase